MTIGERIQNIRKQKGYTLEDLANAVHCTRQTIFKYEKDIITNIPSDRIEAIADFLAVPAATLMGWNVLIEKESQDYQEALDLYTKYLEAAPQIRHAVDALLKPEKPEP